MRGGTGERFARGGGEGKRVDVKWKGGEEGGLLLARQGGGIRGVGDRGGGRASRHRVRAGLVQREPRGPVVRGGMQVVFSEGGEGMGRERTAGERSLLLCRREQRVWLVGGAGVDCP